MPQVCKEIPYTYRTCNFSVCSVEKAFSVNKMKHCEHWKKQRRLREFGQTKDTFPMSQSDKLKEYREILVRNAT